MTDVLHVKIYKIDESHIQQKGLAIEGMGYMNIAYEECERLRQELTKKEESIDLDDFGDGDKIGEIEVENPESAEIEWDEELV